jgi:hypothetical protein
MLYKTAMRIRSATPLLVLWLAACGDDLRSDGGGDGTGDGPDGGTVEMCVDSAVTDFPDEPYGAPDDLPIDGCIAGGLAEVDLTGRWIVSGEDIFSAELPYLRDSCEEGFEVAGFFAGGDPPLMHRDDSRIFWRAQFEGEGFYYAVAYHACAVDDSGELAVVSGSCFNDSCSQAPARMKRFDRPAGEVEADGLELVSEWRGGDQPWEQTLSFNVQVKDGVAFVSRAGELRLVDVSDPAHPRDLGRHASADPYAFADFNDVKVFEAAGGLHAVLAGDFTPVIDARDPENPVVAAEIGEYSHSVFVRIENGRPLAYLANYEDHVPIYDLSDPSSPQLVRRVPLSPDAQVHDLFAERNRLYVNATTGGFVLMQRETGGPWQRRGQLDSSYSHASWVGEVGGRRIAIHGDEGLGAHLRVVDVDPSSDDFMKEIGTYETRPEVSIHNMMLIGSRAYVAYYQDGVRVIDMSDPTAPALAAYHHTWDLETGSSFAFSGAIGIHVDPATGLIYVADTDRGLLVFRETR